MHFRAARILTPRREIREVLSRLECRAVEAMKMAVRLSFVLGVLSLVAVGVSHLALTDISHGAGGSAEWGALQVSFALIIAFQISALMTLWRIIRAGRT